MKSGDLKKGVTKSLRMILIDLIIIFGVVLGLVYYYHHSVKRSLATRSQIQNTKAVQDKDLGHVTFYDSTDHKNIEILVEIAQTDYEQSKGLMFREDLPDNQGMLFVFKDQDVRYFWMKNTPVSLDIIFVDNTFKIVKIHKYTHPMSENTYSSYSPAQYVIEVRAGFTDRYGITEGESISWKRE